MFMITKQGKEVNYSDILLYSVNKKDIIVIVNDEEQMKKFSRTGKGTDAPIAVVPYTDDELIKIIDTMKQIVNFKSNEEGNIEVEYSDGTKVKFDVSNESVIKSISSKPNIFHDKGEDGHYDLLSAFQKSIRGSDPDAAIY